MDVSQMTQRNRPVVRKLGLRCGDLVEVRSREEILSTLDAKGCLEALPFMPEMLEHCGKRFRVYRSAHKTCDTISGTGGRRMADAVHLEGLRCDGAAHGGCQAACLLFWKEAWLKRVPERSRTLLPFPGRRSAPRASECTKEGLEVATQRARRQDEGSEPIYVCQATELVRATSYLPWWDPRQYLCDLLSGNATFSELAAGLYFRFTTHAMGLLGYRFWLGLYNWVQSRRGDIPYPEIRGTLARTPSETLGLEPGEEVEVKSLQEIVNTLDKRNRNRGMAFDKEMVTFCGERRRVLQRVERVVDESTGRILELSNDCITLEGVFCRSRYSDRRIGCPRAIYSYWRECWLRRVEPESS
jgi:hypothetical protein